jgi:hypothetical protein
MSALILFCTSEVATVIGYVCFELTLREAHKEKLTQFAAHKEKQS